MELLLILLYASICIVVFKVFRIPVNQWSLSTAVLGGIVGIAALFISMAYNHPFSANARIYFSVTPVYAGVRGRVIEVPVQANTPLKAGDVLFRIDPSSYQYVVDQKKALVAEAEQNVEQLKASYEAATAAANRAEAQYELAKANYGRQLELFQKQVIAQAALDTYSRNLETSRQTLAEAAADQERARLAYGVNIDGVNTTVARLRSELADAEFNLAQTTVRAYADGFVTQLSLRPGMYAVPYSFRPLMVFVNTDERDRALGVAFRQNSLQRVKAGDEAEVAFNGIPGTVFKGKVHIVLDAIATGQIEAWGGLEDYGAQPNSGRALALIDLQSDLSSYQLPLGAAGVAANGQGHGQAHGHGH